MPYENVRRAYPEPKPGLQVPQDRYDRDLWTGVLDLVWWIDPQHPAAIGTGAVELVTVREVVLPTAPQRRQVPGANVRSLRSAPFETAAANDKRHVVSRIAAAAGEPVLPGSSLKGAVRQVFEMLSPSCYHEDPQPRTKRKPERCPFPKHQRGQEPKWFCPACSFFGGEGLGGRVSFGEARGVPGKYKVGQETVPTAWEPHDEKVEPGAYRIYDLRPDVDYIGNKRPLVQPTQVASGFFRSKLWLVNANPEELGLLFAALGVGEKPPGLRIGGKRFQGFGAADVNVRLARRRSPDEHKEGKAVVEWVLALKDQALAVAPRLERYQHLQQVISRGRKGAKP